MDLLTKKIRATGWGGERGVLKFRPQTQITVRITTSFLKSWSWNHEWRGLNFRMMKQKWELHFYNGLNTDMAIKKQMVLFLFRLKKPKNLIVFFLGGGGWDTAETVLQTPVDIIYCTLFSCMSWVSSLLSSPQRGSSSHSNQNHPSQTSQTSALLPNHPWMGDLRQNGHDIMSTFKGAGQTHQITVTVISWPTAEQGWCVVRNSLTDGHQSSTVVQSAHRRRHFDESIIIAEASEY